ncbi:SMI1 / KNR4 family protein [Marinomonas gallaica]|uniref:SMI1 / KNR4 family protein n=1 Tax=Marinomonas gallaica TaxID=1806667 RepID=A0A1C3JNJ7_9GAMM|nr:SMI1/KNR4 family protein [Marinomonas gallaica]SBT16756.1 SMI1 / KNR4 family protein [Marinomonas gallaica]SBT20472.1 SMI1 / KNR4 family protein [Marinomonas gallaica]
MLKTINWEEYLKLNIDTQDVSTIKIFEKRVGIEFPAEYYDLIVPNQGKTPELYLINIGRAEVEVGPVFHFLESGNGAHSSYGMGYMRNVWEKHYPKLVPFIGAGGSGSCFALDYSKGAVPKVVFINAEAEPGGAKSIFLVADSITEFLSSLKDED